ncbi:anthranilate phosphoribosyltransferase [Novispirillum itersonii]|uniref:Anthranilate phosphoribosyltransferase n=1 Tax=Novispirillum itersonii TaxID=189 RepID=A0A7W9ZFL3_NOVIT|nr:anthranilate phosphoribosyltransferase [Novispirillum itersonii]MBB6210596.1 anthranilate phosphoribosyltransferase [Novispirillum itersonii]
MSGLKDILPRLALGETLSEAEAESAFNIIMTGEATPSQIGGFLMALRLRGETVEEITAAARVMRGKAHRLTAPIGAIDVVGTGGDGVGTFNISTGAALVIAGAGVPVAKHGNRAASSKSGSADVLAALGVNLDADMALVEQAMRDAGIGFMMAQRHHAAMRHVAPARTEMGMRTIFNLLGPLTNPAGASFQLLGVFDARWVEPIAAALLNLGLTRAMVVHGSDGLDEVTTTGPTLVAELRDGVVRRWEITPEMAGIPRVTLDALKGGDPEHNAQVIRDMLDGAPGPYRDIVVLNAAAALMVAGKADDIAAGADLARTAIDSGAARTALDRLVAVTNTPITPREQD